MRINFMTSREKKDKLSSFVIPYKCGCSNANFSISGTNRIIKIYVAKQFEFVTVIL